MKPLPPALFPNAQLHGINYAMIRGGAEKAQFSFSSLALLVIVLLKSFISTSAVAATASVKTPLGSNALASNSSFCDIESDLNPLLVQKRDVDALVQECLKDPSINIAAIPDYLERQVYRFTIQLTLNSLYKALGGINGRKLLGHSLKLTRVPCKQEKIKNALLNMDKDTDLHDEVLEQVADRLLENKMINLPLVPDILERQIYANCLKIVFRVLDLLTTSFNITLCGHELGLRLEPNPERLREVALQRAISNDPTFLTSLTRERMLQLARESAGDEFGDRRWFWQRMMSPSNNAMVAQIYASVYCLILGVLDDVVGNTEMNIFTDKICFDLITPHSNDVRSQSTSTMREEKKKMFGNTIRTFFVGVAAGLILRPSLMENVSTTGKHPLAWTKIARKKSSNYGWIRPDTRIRFARATNSESSFARK